MLKNDFFLNFPIWAKFITHLKLFWGKSGGGQGKKTVGETCPPVYCFVACEYRFSLQILIFFNVKSTTVTQKSVAQENALKIEQNFVFKNRAKPCQLFFS